MVRASERAPRALLGHAGLDRGVRQREARVQDVRARGEAARQPGLQAGRSKKDREDSFHARFDANKVKNVPVDDSPSIGPPTRPRR